MSLRDGSSRSSSVVTTGSRPTNSGMRPYFKRCGSGKPFRGADSALSPASVGYPDACDGRDMPLFCAPTALQRLFHHDGERAVAKAAEKFGTMFGISSLGTISIEEIGSTISTPKLFQLYFHKDRGLTNSMIERCVAANFDVLALTVDTITGGNRERDLRTGFTSPPRLTVKSLLSFAMHPRWAADYFMHEKFELPQVKDYVKEGSNISISVGDYFSTMLDQSMNWQDAADVRKKWGKQFCLKGVMSVADAKRAVEIGATAIMVSNQGGRQLDGSRSPFDQLAEIVDAVGDKIDVICDGGMARGHARFESPFRGRKSVFGREILSVCLGGRGPGRRRKGSQKSV